MTVSTFKLGTLFRISKELLSDNAFGLEDYAVREFARHNFHLNEVHHERGSWVFAGCSGGL